MAGFNNEASAKQTGFNDSAALIKGMLEAGFIESKDEALELYFDTAEATFQDIKALLDAQAATSGPSKGSSSPQEPITAFTWGKHNGESFEDVQASDPSYLEWLTEKDTNPKRNAAREAVKKFLEDKKAGV